MPVDLGASLHSRADGAKVCEAEQFWRGLPGASSFFFRLIDSFLHPAGAWLISIQKSE